MQEIWRYLQFLCVRYRDNAAGDDWFIIKLRQHRDLNTSSNVCPTKLNEHTEVFYPH